MKSFYSFKGIPKTIWSSLKKDKETTFEINY